MPLATMQVALQKEPLFSTHEGSASQGGNVLGPGTCERKKKKASRDILLNWPGLVVGGGKDVGLRGVWSSVDQRMRWLKQEDGSAAQCK